MEVMDKNLVHNIIMSIDTGACEESIIKDCSRYHRDDVSACLKEMLRLGLCEDRGAYLVFMHRHPLAKEYYECKASMES